MRLTSNGVGVHRWRGMQRGGSKFCVHEELGNDTVRVHGGGGVLLRDDDPNRNFRVQLDCEILVQRRQFVLAWYYLS